MEQPDISISSNAVGLTFSREHWYVCRVVRLWAPGTCLEGCVYVRVPDWYETGTNAISACVVSFTCAQRRQTKRYQCDPWGVWTCIPANIICCFQLTIHIFENLTPGLCIIVWKTTYLFNQFEKNTLPDHPPQGEGAGVEGLGRVFV
jgi:hypothetical protein